MQHLLEGLTLLGWACPWTVGGVLLAMSVFRLRRHEVAIIGLSLGLVLEIWLANILAQILGIPLAFWVASAVVFAAGIAAQVAHGDWHLPAFSVWTWTMLAGLTLLFNAIGRGLGIFDDYQNLPTVSLMAAGDVPPHFALDPSLRFGYHYLLLLFASQLMRLGAMLPWSALDLARGLVLALPLVLAAHWAYRLTRRWLAACLCSAVLAFAGGARWLLLLLPPSWLGTISGQISLIGSASSSATSLAEAMISPWRIDGAGPIPFPFAFYSGVNQPYVMLYTGIAGSGVLILLLLLMTATRWQNRGAAFVTIALIAALAIANEIAFLLLGTGLLIAGITGAMHRSARLGAGGIATWLGVAAMALVVAAFQGGMLTEAVRTMIGTNAAASSYFDPTPTLVWPPAIVSAHMGSLSLAQPSQLLVAILEIGPVVLITPAVLARGWRSLRRGRWLEAGFIASSVGLFGGLFLAFRGPLFTAAPRLLSGWILVCTLYFVPMAWAWSAQRSDRRRISAIVVGAVSTFGGLVLFAVQLAAIQSPVYSTFISEMDARMTESQWNRLDVGALVFDPLVYRAPTVLGRPTRSSLSWYQRSVAWEHLRDAADPRAIAAAGFSYMYLDGQYWDQLSGDQQIALRDSCVIQVDRVDGVRGPSDYTKDFRILLDIRACR